ncbi:metal-dependent hydrolase [Haloferax sp. Atlit-6N]|uniref:metal-dependent hydrolase n=1 Tax=Haloferax sp. Atlit-6N TaxID=2077205 RepID=UPI000E231F9C|nr:metal-dependent hydrolase [Haloferax sp. Atlit-6N]REA05780.1 metal-dependent hydrolase [Haloferax sp. Atlit-6N]
MYKTGHQGAAFLFATPFALFAGLFGEPAVILFGAFVVSGLASAPDLDLRTRFIKHRGITHTVWAALATGVVTSIVGLAVGFAYGGVLAGIGFLFFFGLLGVFTILSHIAADALTPMGVRPFAPVSSKRYTWSLVKAANPIANYALAGLGFGLCVGAVLIGTWLHSAVTSAV